MISKEKKYTLEEFKAHMNKSASEKQLKLVKELLEKKDFETLTNGQAKNLIDALKFIQPKNR